MTKVLAICGSLRKRSSNRAFLEAAQAISPKEIDLQIFEGLADLPLFSPDLEGNEPESVLRFRAEIKMADAVMIASPEYAHGITGVLKNALDWVVGSGEFIAKPLALINTSGRAAHAYASLKEILKTMDAKILEEASLTIPLVHTNMQKEEIVAHAQIKALIQNALEALLVLQEKTLGLSQ